VILSGEENIMDRVKQITGRRMAYAAVDAVAGDMTDSLAAATRPGGTIYVRHSMRYLPQRLNQLMASNWLLTIN
jgi:NADPH:quinone reductase-like Zn-dependent oxidoreductase